MKIPGSWFLVPSFLVLLQGCGGRTKTAKTPEALPVATDKEAVGAFLKEIQHLQGKFQVCHDRARALHHHTAGQIEFELAVPEPPQTVSVQILGNSTGSDLLANCAKQRIAEYDWTGILSPGQRFRSSLAFPNRGPNYTVLEQNVDPIKVSESFAVTPLLDVQNSDNPDASLAIWRVAGELPVESFAGHEIWFVLDGEGRIYAAKGSKKAQKLAAGSVVYVPKGTPRGFRQSGSKPLLAVVAYAPAGPEQRFEPAPATPSEPAPAAVPEKKSKKKKKDAPQKMVVKQIGRIKVKSIPNGEIRGIIGKSDKAEVYVGAVTLFAKAAIPAHTHPESSEILYVLEGGGEMTIGPDTYPIGPGMAIQVPRGLEHSFVSTAPTATKAIQMYVPRGPEDQRYGKKGKK
jgi:mannose-6-phosphate isomerase-like protein (cupin superfamily)